MTIELDDAEIEALRQLQAEWALTPEGSRLPASIVRKLSLDPHVPVACPEEDGTDLLTSYMVRLDPHPKHPWKAVLVVKYHVKIDASMRLLTSELESDLRRDPQNVAEIWEKIETSFARASVSPPPKESGDVADHDRKFTVWTACGHAGAPASEEVVLVAAGEDADEICSTYLDTMIANNFDTGWEEAPAGAKLTDTLEKLRRCRPAAIATSSPRIPMPMRATAWGRMCGAWRRRSSRVFRTSASWR